jgi:hypothetical protein
MPAQQRFGLDGSHPASHDGLEPGFEMVLGQCLTQLLANGLTPHRLSCKDGVK